MEKIKKYEAFTRAVAAFGEWRTWNRWHHIAYGLIRGVPYVAMERYCNDTPDHWSTMRALLKLGAWPECPAGNGTEAWNAHKVYHEEVSKSVVWVRKPVRVKRVRTEPALPLAEGA